MKKAYNLSKRIQITMFVLFILMALLVIRIAYIQFVQGASLKKEMYNQLVTSRTISPNRGTIFDSTGKALAISANVDTISIVPNSIVVLDENNKIDESETKSLKESLSKVLSEAFNLDYNKTLETVSSDSDYVTIARKVEKENVDILKVWMEENDFYSGINIVEDTKRYYPYNNLASSLIGFCGTDNDGLEGIEKAWDDVLTGTPGMVITQQDAISGFIPDTNQTYIAAKNGSNIVLSIDANIQSIVEKYLKQACIDNDCSRGGNVVAMNPKTGDILAIATYPDYNLNTPFDTPSYISKKTWDKMSLDNQYDTLYSLFRNRAISDPYEPGSVFKTITASIALEEELASPDVPSVYYCKGYESIYGVKISCAYSYGHEYQSLRDAFAVSCNPSFIQINQKIGASTCYKYYKAFGLFDTTGIDTVGESNSIFWDLDNVGPIELATMSFGQRFRVTPLQITTAICAIANKGVLVKPRIVKEIVNTDTNAVTTIDPVEIRQVVSKKTADTMMDLLDTVVSTGSGKYAQIKGYSIAGKTGTSEPDYNNKDEGYTASFIAISPTESPEIVLLVTLYDPQGPKGYSGNTVAAPVAAQMLSEILPYMQISTDNSDSSSSKTISLPNVENKTIAEAKKVLEKAGFNVSTLGDNSDIVTEQFPAKGSELLKDSIIKLYTEKENTRISVKVPDLTGKSLSSVKSLLKEKNLNYIATGSGQVVSQDPISNTLVEEGSVVKVTLGN